MTAADRPAVTVDAADLRAALRMLDHYLRDGVANDEPNAAWYEVDRLRAALDAAEAGAVVTAADRAREARLWADALDAWPALHQPPWDASLLRTLADDVERLTRERDEAQRVLCAWHDALAADLLPAMVSEAASRHFRTCTEPPDLPYDDGCPMHGEEVSRDRR